jgi:hypothetical protein
MKAGTVIQRSDISVENEGPVSRSTGEPAMSVRPRRPVSLRDAMILVALVALGLAGGKAYSDYDRATYLLGPLNPYPVDRAVCSLTVFLLIGNAGLLVVRVLQKARRRILARGAGTAASLASVVAAAFSWANVILHQLYAVGKTVARYVYHVVANVPHDAGPSVLTVWAVLALSRRWRANDWVERAGVTLGVLWVLLYIYQGLLSRWILTLTSS